jgi:hypothetical protein
LALQQKGNFSQTPTTTTPILLSRLSFVFNGLLLLLKFFPKRYDLNQQQQQK